VGGYAGQRQLSEAELALVPALIRASLLAGAAFRLAQWAREPRLRVRAVASIARTVSQRLPSLDRVERELLEVASRANDEAR
jgi:Ser/Thr protein kinase RdoA (MazF antagonist)